MLISSKPNNQKSYTHGCNKITISGLFLQYFWIFKPNVFHQRLLLFQGRRERPLRPSNSLGLNSSFIDDCTFRLANIRHYLNRDWGSLFSQKNGKKYKVKQYHVWGYELTVSKFQTREFQFISLWFHANEPLLFKILCHFFINSNI